MADNSQQTEKTGRVLQPHGTLAAVRRHERAGEPLCPACVAARREKNRQAARRFRERARESRDGGGTLRG